MWSLCLLAFAFAFAFEFEFAFAFAFSSAVAFAFAFAFAFTFAPNSNREWGSVCSTNQPGSFVGVSTTEDVTLVALPSADGVAVVEADEFPRLKAGIGGGALPRICLRMYSASMYPQRTAWSPPI